MPGAHRARTFRRSVRDLEVMTAKIEFARCGQFSTVSGQTIYADSPKTALDKTSRRSGFARLLAGRVSTQRSKPRAI